MANDKKFIVKNGLLTPENAVIGSSTDTGEKLQVTGDTVLTQSTAGTPTLKVTNSGGNSAIIGQFEGDASALQVKNLTTGDYQLVNTGNNNGIIFYNDTGGISIQYNGGDRLVISNSGNEFSGLSNTTIDGNRILTTADEGAGNGLDADTVDGLEAAQFVRADVDDIMAGNYTIQQNLTISGDLTVSGNTTTVNTEEILLADNIITINSNYTGSTPSEDGGIEVERGTLANAKIIWNESQDYWQLEVNGSALGRIITTADEGSGNGFDADTVDGLEAAQFLRSDADDTATGNITIEGDLTVGDNAGPAQIFFDGQNNNRTLYSNNGEIGFLNNSANWAMKSDASGDLEVERDVEAGRDVTADRNIVADDNITATTGNVSATAGDVTAGDDVIAQNNVTATTGNVSATAGNVTAGNDITAQNDITATTGDIEATAGSVTAQVDVTATTGNVSATAGNVTAGDSMTAQNDITATTGNITATAGSVDAGTSVSAGTTVTGGTGVTATTGDVTATVGNVRAGEDVYGKKFIDVNDGTYIVNPNADSTMHSIGLDDDLFHNGDTDTKIQFTTDDISLQTGGSERLGVDNTGVDITGDLDVTGDISGGTGTFTGDVTAPRFVDADDTNYFADPAGDSQFNTVDIDDYVRHRGDTNTYIGFPANDNIRFATNGTERVLIDNTYVTSSLDGIFPNLYAGRYYDSSNATYYGDFASTSRVNNISLVGQIIHDGDTNTYIEFHNADQFRVVTGGAERFEVNNTYVLANNQMRSPIYYDSADTTYYLNPNGDSQLDEVHVNDWIRHRGDTNTYLGFPANDQIELTTGGGIRATITNTNATFNSDVLADRFVDRQSTGYYLNPADATLSATLNGSVRIANIANSTRYSDNTGTGGIVLAGDADIAANQSTTLAISGQYRSGAYSLMYLNRIDANVNPFNAGNRYIEFRADGGGTTPAAFRGDSSGNLYLTPQNSQHIGFWTSSGNEVAVALDDGNFVVGGSSVSYTSMDNTPLVGSITNNKLHVNGSIQLTSNDDAIVIGRGTATFLKDEELGFGWGGGWYMTDGTYLRSRSNKTIYTAGDIWASRYYAHSSTSYYLDPDGDSQLNTVDIDDYIRHRGDTNTLLGFSGNDSILFQTNGSNRASINNSRMRVRSKLEVWGSGIELQKQSNSGGVGITMTDQGSTETPGLGGLQTVSIKAWHADNSYTTGANMAMAFESSEPTTHYVFSTNNNAAGGNVIPRVTNTGSLGLTNYKWANIYATAANIDNIYASRYYDADDNSFYGDFNSRSEMNSVNLRHNSAVVSGNGNFNVASSVLGGLHFRNGNGVNGAPRMAAITFQGDSATTAQAGIYVSNDNSSGTHMAFAVTDSYANGPYLTARFRNDGLFQTYRQYALFAGSARAPLFYDSNNTAFYTDPASTSQMNRIDIEDYIRHRNDTNTYFGFASNDTFRVWTNGTQRLNIDNNSLDSAVNVYAPRYYDSNATSRYIEPGGGGLLEGNFEFASASTSRGYSTAAIELRESNFTGSAAATPPVLGFHWGGVVASTISMASDGTIEIRNNPGTGYEKFRALQVSANIYYDANNTGYYGDFASTSRMNRIDWNDSRAISGGISYYYTAAGNLRGYIQATDTNDAHFIIATSGGEDISFRDGGLAGDWNMIIRGNGQTLIRSRLDSPIMYDRDDTGYYSDPASTSRLNRIHGNARGDNTNIGTINTTNQQSDWQNLVNTTGKFTVTQYNNISNYTNSPASVYTYGSVLSTRTDNHSFQLYSAHTGDLAYKTQWNNDNSSGWLTPVVYGRNAGSASGKNIYFNVGYDSDNTGYYIDPHSNTRLNTVQALRYYMNHGTSYWIDESSGSYGSIMTGGRRNGWAGYSIEGNYVFMANTSEMGIYNDIDNEWMLYGQRNGYIDLRYNGSRQAQTASGYFLANNQMRAPIYYDSSNTAYYLDPASSNTSNALKVAGRIRRDNFQTSGDGNNNRLLEAQDYSHWIWNTASDWGIFWAGNNNPYRSHFSTSNPNEIVFIGNGTLRASIDLDNGNAHFTGTVSAGSFALNGGNENIEIIKSYGSGGADLVLFDGTEYFDKRVIKAMAPNESPLTGTTSEFVRTTNGPFAGSYVLQTSAYRTFYSDYIPVAPGEDLYGEISARRVSGSGGLLYYGIERFDSQKRPIAGNTGTTYFVVGGTNLTSTSWTTYRNHTTIPTSHTPYGGSDGGGCYYVRIRILMNYNSGGALRQFAGIMLKRRNAESNLLVDDLLADDITADEVTANVFRDRANPSTFYVDPASISYMNDVRPSIIYDRDNTGYYLNPNSTSYWNTSQQNGYHTFLNYGIGVTGTYTSTRLQQVFAMGSSYRLPADGNSTANMYGIAWSHPNAGSKGGANNLNDHGMLIINNGSFRAAISSRAVFSQDVRGTLFYDYNNTGYYVDPASTSRLNYLRLSSSDSYLKIGANDVTTTTRDTNRPQIEIGQNHAYPHLTLWSYGSNTTHGGVISFRSRQGGGFRRWNIGTANYNPDNLSIGYYDNNNNPHYGVGTGWSYPARWWITAAGDNYATGSMRAPIFYDSNNTGYYGDFASESRFNTFTTAGRVVIGGTFSNNAYSSTNSTRLHFGGGNSDANSNYYIGTNKENYNGNYNKLDLRWHTGIRMGAQATYGGTRIYNNEDLSTVLVSIGKGDTHTRVESGNLYVTNDARASLFYDINDTNYYLDPANNARLWQVGIGYRSAGKRLDVTGDHGNTAIRLELPAGNNGAGEGSIPLQMWVSEPGRTWSGAGFGYNVDNNLNGGTNQYYLGRPNTSHGQAYMRFDTNGYMTFYNTNTSGTRYETLQTRSNNTVYVPNYLFAGSSLRAPIFYDTNDTNYYANPASNSRFNTAQFVGDVNFDGGAGAIELTSSDIRSNGSSSWTGNPGSTVGKIQMHSNRWYIVSNGNSNRIVQFRQNGSDRSYIANDGRLIGPGVSATSDVRAPIFYDSDDTTYKADFNSTSNTAMRFRGGTLHGPNPTWGRYLYVGTNGNVSSEACVATTNGNLHLDSRSGNNLYLQWYVGGTVYVNNAIQAQIYYDRNDTNYYGDFASTSYMNDVRTNILYDRNNTAYYVHNSSGDASMRTVTVDRLNMRDRGDFITFYGNDSDYHSISSRDNGGGVTDDLRFNSYHDIFFNLDSNNNNSTGSTGFYIGHHGAGTGGISGWPFQAMMDGNTYSTSSFRSNVFYARSNTSYYMDPDATSRLRAVYANDWFRADGGSGLYFQDYGYGLRGAQAEGNPYGNVSTYNIGRNGWGGYGIGSRWTWMSTEGNNVGVHDNNRGWLQYYNGSYTDFNYGHVQSDSSFRAPIFYDLNDTGYYMNPNSDSHWQGLTARGQAMIGLQGMTRSGAISNYGRRPNITSDSNYWTGSKGWGRVDMNTVGNWGSGFFDSWSNPGNQPSGTSHWVGVQSYHYSNGSARYGWQMAGGPIANLRFRNSWSGFSSWKTIPVLGVNDNNGAAMYASIYYDSNNTGYFCDPAGRSRLSTIDFGNGSYYMREGSWGMRNQTPYGYIEFGPANSSHAHIYTDRSNFYFNRLIQVNGRSRMDTNDIRSDIFYDLNNTGYYTNPASTSRMNQITVNRLNSPYAGGNSGITRASSPYSFGFQESGGWSSPYPDLVLQFHTGMSFAANPSYGGMRFFNDYNSGTVRFQINGGSSYTYANTWLRVAGANQGIYSSHAGAHFEPNNHTSYGSWNIRGSRSGWYGISFHEPTWDPHLMFDGNGSGGIYMQGGGRWVYYHNRSNNCTGFASSSTVGGYRVRINGSLYCNGNVVAYSDERDKENIVTIDGALDKVLQLRGVYYERKTREHLVDDRDEIYKGRQLGLIAQEVLDIVPEVVSYADELDQYGLDYPKMVGLLVEGIKDQHKIVEDQQKLINSQQEKIDKLEEMVYNIMNKMENK